MAGNQHLEHQHTTSSIGPSASFRVSGMTCAGCAAGLQKMLANDPQVQFASVSIISGIAQVRSSLSDTDIIQRIRSRGFDATLELPSAAGSALEQQQQTTTRLWKRRAILGLSLWLPLEVLHWTATALHWHPTWMPLLMAGGSGDRKSTRLNSSHIPLSRMPSSA